MPDAIGTGDVTLEVNAQSIRDFPVDDLTPVINYVRPGSRPAVTGMNIDWKEAYVLLGPRRSAGSPRPSGIRG
jgi:hypothetical protein